MLRIAEGRAVGKDRPGPQPPGQAWGSRGPGAAPIQLRGESPARSINLHIHCSRKPEKWGALRPWRGARGRVSHALCGSITRDCPQPLHLRDLPSDLPPTFRLIALLATVSAQRGWGSKAARPARDAECTQLALSEDRESRKPSVCRDEWGSFLSSPRHTPALGTPQVLPQPLQQLLPGRNWPSRAIRAVGAAGGGCSWWPWQLPLPTRAEFRPHHPPPRPWWSLTAY